MDKDAEERGDDKLSEKEHKADAIAGKYHRGASSFVMGDYSGRVNSDTNKYLDRQNRASSVAGKYHRGASSVGIGADSVGVDVEGLENGGYSRYSDRESKVQNLEQKFQGLANDMKKKKKAQDESHDY